MRNLIFVVIVAAVVAGCSERSGAEDAARAALIDPDSAQFGEFTVADDGENACLGVNAKNRMGGYVGETQFVLRKYDDEWVTVGDTERTHADCIANLNREASRRANRTPEEEIAELEALVRDAEAAVEAGGYDTTGAED